MYLIEFLQCNLTNSLASKRQKDLTIQSSKVPKCTTERIKSSPCASVWAIPSYSTHYPYPSSDIKARQLMKKLTPHTLLLRISIQERKLTRK